MSRNTAPYRDALREASKKQADIGKVTSLLKRALKAGDPEAAYALGTWYLHGQHVKQDRRKAVRLLREAADSNVANALYDLAVCYEKGAGIKKSPRLAFECYLRAALQGEEQSFYEVGRCFYYGVGTSKDTRVARIWIDRARELGISESANKESLTDRTASPRARKVRARTRSSRR
jgi:TPR repeat protein